MAKEENQIAWIELGYYVGMIFGLIIWKILNIEISLVSALWIDAVLQFIAGWMDLRARKFLEEDTLPTLKTTLSPFSFQEHRKSWLWRLSITVVFLTISTQAVIFNLIYFVSEFFSVFILASYYLGAAFGALFCKKFKAHLKWITTKGHYFGHAVIQGEYKKSRFNIHCLTIGLLILACVSLTIFGVSFKWNGLNHLDKTDFFLLSLVCCSAFLYEIFVLTLLERMSLEEKNFPANNMIIRTYGLMGISVSSSLFLLGALQNAYYSLFVILSCGITFPYFFMLRRKISA